MVKNMSELQYEIETFENNVQATRNILDQLIQSNNRLLEQSGAFEQINNQFEQINNQLNEYRTATIEQIENFNEKTFHRYDKLQTEAQELMRQTEKNVIKSFEETANSNKQNFDRLASRLNEILFSINALNEDMLNINNSHLNKLKFMNIFLSALMIINIIINIV